MSVAIVILNWNGKGFLEKFIPNVLANSSIGDTSDRNALIVADNGSEDGSVEWLKGSHPEVGIIELDKNYGFTGGYNRAFEHIKASGKQYDYYLLLNSDIEVTPGWVDSLVSFMESHRECGACAPKIRCYSAPEYFEHAGAAGGFLDWCYLPYCRGRVLSKVEKDLGQYDNSIQCFWASGAAFLIRSELWWQMGGLDELFFAHMEEIDLCWRLQLGGWQIWSVSDSVVFHVGGGTLPNNSPRKIYLNFRNNLLMMYKNLPQRNRSRIIFFRQLLDGLFGVLYLLMGKFSYTKMIIKAHKDFRKMKSQMVITPQNSPVKRSKVFLPFLALKG
ncbi:MAG: glycosyltransferase family 2 protein [Bacteroidales bacterium]|nr:glycosyltransferase family 2 protein [Bacteroidales bacterium]